MTVVETASGQTMLLLVPGETTARAIVIVDKALVHVEDVEDVEERVESVVELVRNLLAGDLHEGVL
jgi:hypothetical protein